MATNKNVNATEEQSRALAEESRQTSWEGKGFLRNLFLGDLRVDWIDPFPETEPSPEYKAFYSKMEAFLEEKVDSVKIDAEGQYGDDVLNGLRALGAFGMKIPKKYGGLGFNNVEYCRVLEMVGRYDGNITALLSAHQSIGVPQPVKLFGTEEQKQRFLPRCAAGAISAFALTEADVGSDPARVGTQAVKDANGDFVITGEKLWCSNGTIAELFVVMARNPETNKISAFVVEASSPGVEVAYRCRFMGLRALENGIIRFNGVKVPKENLISTEGSGLKVALVTLNAGRLSIPAATVGSSKAMLEEARRWATERVQWGMPIGKHEAISHMLADLAATTYGMDSLAFLACELSELQGYDIRLEASAAKEWCTTRNWDMIDTAMQIKGGRGYETEISLAGRGERAVGIERAMRDSRINRIFEGSSEIMHLLMARELVDQHLKLAGVMLEPKSTIGEKLAALPAMLKFYVPWYSKLWLGSLFRPSYTRFGKLASHLKYVEAASRRLARTVFHGMVWYQKKMERKQAFLFRSVDIAMELFVMTATIARTRKLIDARSPDAKAAEEMTELFCRNATHYVDQKFKELWDNDDDFKSAVGRSVLDERHAWLEPKRTYTPSAASSGSSESAAAK